MCWICKILFHEIEDRLVMTDDDFFFVLSSCIDFKSSAGKNFSGCFWWRGCVCPHCAGGLLLSVSSSEEADR